jgi:hypothetical protein
LQALTTGPISPAATDASDLVNSVAFAAGDTIGIQIDKSGAIGSSPNDVFCSVKVGF